MKSGVIKSADVAVFSSVRPLPASAEPTPPVDEERERLRRRVATLESEARQHQSALSRLRAEIERAFAEGKTQGHQSGLSEAMRRDAERLEVLKQGIARAQTLIGENLTGLERLAAVLAREALTLVMANPDYRGEILSAIIAAQVTKLEKSLLLGIALSPEDFPEPAALHAVAERLGLTPALLETSVDIPPGGCVMRLRLGQLDIGLDQQWDAVRELLSDISLPEISP